MGYSGKQESIGQEEMLFESGKLELRNGGLLWRRIPCFSILGVA
jgi:hypothetical protein